jgi:hypothetical protein
MGDNTETFNVHTALLTARSEFFKKALNGAWKEAEDKVFKLPEDDPANFATYVHHLYTGELAVRTDPQDSDDYGIEEQAQLARLYVGS